MDMHVYSIRIPCTEMMKKKVTLERKGGTNISTTVTDIFPSQAYWILASITNTGRTVTFHLEKTGDSKYSSQINGL